MRGIQSFSLSLEVQQRIARAATDPSVIRHLQAAQMQTSRARMLEEPVLVHIPELDVNGLTPEDYDELYTWVGVPGQRRARDYASFRTLLRQQRLLTALDARVRQNRKNARSAALINKRRTKHVESHNRAVARTLPSAKNLSSMVEVLLGIGLDVIAERARNGGEESGTSTQHKQANTEYIDSPRKHARQAGTELPRYAGRKAARI